MKIKFNETVLQFDVTITDNNVGLKEGDNWCNIKFLIDNKNCHYESEGLFLTRDELVRSSKDVFKFYDSEKPKRQKLTFIKNYFWLILEEIDNHKQMYIYLNDVVSIDDMIVHTYTVTLTDDEIIEFVNRVYSQVC